MMILEKLTFGEFCFDVVLWLVFLVTNAQYLIPNSRCEMAYCRDKNYIPLFLFLLVFCTFDFIGGDFFHYLNLYKSNSSLNTNLSGQHLEAFYLWLIKVLPGNYFVWRFTVWGIASLLLVATFKRFHLPARISALAFLLVISVVFASFRNSLGFVTLFFGSTFLFSNKGSKFLNLLIFAECLICSLFLHRSMFIFATLFCVALIPIGKRTYLISVLLFPVLYRLIGGYAYQILGSSLVSEDSAANGIGYLESEFRVETTLMGYVQLALSRLPIYVILIYSIINIYFKRQVVSYSVKTYLNVTYFLVYISLLWRGQEVSAFLTNRFHDSAMFFCSVFLAMYMPTLPNSKVLRRCLIVLSVASFYAFAYAFYKHKFL